VALEAFYREHVEAVQRFVARRVGDPHLAADLTAEIFLAAIESADGYRPSDGDPAGWLYGVARNVVSAAFRRGGRERRALGRVAGRELMDADDIDRMVDRLDAEAGSRRLYEAMDELPAGERAVLELVALDGLGTAEAARALHITAVAARVRLHRARRRLRPRLTPPDQPVDQPARPAMTLGGTPR
jgi:RNA polymerase sigma-70 factor (ECF subfamily)